MLDSARRKSPVLTLARWLFGRGLAANVTHGVGHGFTGAVVAAWPAVALAGYCTGVVRASRDAGSLQCIET